MSDSGTTGPDVPTQAYDDLHRRFESAAAWMMVSRGVMGAVSIGVSFVMARLLLPQDYGLMQMATVVTGLLAMAQSLGAGSALVQRDRVTPENEEAAFTVALVVSTLLAVVIMLISYPIAWLYADRRVAPVLMALAIVHIVMALRF